MKRVFLLGFVSLFFVTQSVLAQNQMWGVTAHGGPNDVGTIFKANADGSGLMTKYTFGPSIDGEGPSGILTQLPDGKFYSTTIAGGSSAFGTLYDYDPLTNIFHKNIDFDGPVLGAYPAGNLIFYNGKLYGTAYLGGANDSGTIYEFDPATGIINKLHDFADATGSFPRPIALLASNGKIYGTTAAGGANGFGVIYEFDPATGTYLSRFDFPTSTNAYGLTEYTADKLYGMGAMGGNGFGYIFEFDIATSAVTNKFNFDISNPAYNINTNLTKAGNGKFYALTSAGGANGVGALFEFDPSNGNFIVKQDLDVSTTGEIPQGRMVSGPNGKLYGLTTRGGANSLGVMFEFDPTSGVFVNKIDFAGPNGALPDVSIPVFTKETQRISFTLTEKTVGDAPFDLNALASINSGLPISYMSSDPTVASVSGSTITILKAGTTTITASQAGDATYNPAISVDQVLVVNKANQTISFGTLAAVTYGDAPFDLGPIATASSGLPVSFISSDPAVASISGSIVTILKGGSTTISASQAGNNFYNAAANVDQLLTVNKKNQTISFGALPVKTYGDAPIDLSLTATATSGLPVSFISSDPTVASISGSVVTILKGGATTITASQPGNNFYSPASSADQLLTVNKASQTIAFNTISDKIMGDPSFSLTATATSNLPVAFSSSSDKINIVGTQVTLTKAGRATITAAQAGNVNYSSASPVDRSFCIKPAKPSILMVLTNGVTITSSSASGNQWYFNDVLIAGATNQNLIVTQIGVYKVRVKADDCVGDFSDGANIVITGLEDRVDGLLKMYPNPVQDWLTVSFSSVTGQKQVAIYSLDGKRMDAQECGGAETKFDVSRYSQGTYLVTVSVGNSTSAGRFFKK